MKQPSILLNDHLRNLNQDKSSGEQLKGSLVIPSQRFRRIKGSNKDENTSRSPQTPYENIILS